MQVQEQEQEQVQVQVQVLCPGLEEGGVYVRCTCQESS